jgi:hypothetical protein
MRMTTRKCIGGLGGKCVFPKTEEVWVLEIYILLTQLC